LPNDPYKENIEKKRIIEYRKLFNSPTGKWVFLDMCKRYEILKLKGQVDLSPQGLAYSRGTQAVFEDILDKLNKNPMELKQEMAVFDG